MPIRDASYRRLVWVSLSCSLVLALETPLFAPLQVPVLDDRSYDGLVEETAARIPAHVPEWTNFNENDPGATLLDFFDLVNEDTLGALGRDVLEAARELQLPDRLTEDELLHALLAAILDGALLLKPEAPPEWADFTRIDDAKVADLLGRLSSAIPLGSAFRRGDVNADSRRDIADVVWILAELFLGGAPSPCPDASDTDDDGEVTLGDALLILRFRFLGGPAPALPTATCGGDPTPDALGCDAHPSC